MGGNLVKDTDETGYLREDGAREDLMPRHDREFSRHLRHPGSLESGEEPLWKSRLEVQHLRLRPKGREPCDKRARPAATSSRYAPRLLQSRAEFPSGDPARDSLELR